MLQDPQPPTCRSERRLLKAYFEAPVAVKHSAPLPEASAAAVDHTTLRILEKLHPPMLDEFIPLSIVGDGHCMFRAVSYQVYGTQDCYLYLRLLAALEMIEHSDCYDVKSLTYRNTIDNDQIPTADFSTLLKAVTATGSGRDIWGEMMHLYALSAALAMPIYSYYPPTASYGLVNNPYSVVICGRDVRRSQSPDVNVMWSMSTVPRIAKNFMPDHLVVLQRKTGNESTVDIDDEVLQRKTGNESTMDVDDKASNMLNLLDVNNKVISC